MMNTLKCELETKEFSETVQQLIALHSVEEIVETGTFEGTGSTLVFAKTGLPVQTIECNPSRIIQARKNLLAFPNVHIHHALSLRMEDMVAFLKEDNYSFPPGLREDSLTPLDFYLNEIQTEVERENALIDLISTDRKQLIFLDSAGGIGYLEFKAVIGHKQSKGKILMLDDVDHVKHYRSVKELSFAKTSSDGRFAWAIL